ncbi:MAG TPA: cobalamin-independent methionine synthase II family protein [Solirubrobacteraceae bacterium]|nr:cobalamin-independent methionine synthase II family protein [Solirubrobacteraceae bacterium]
MPLRTEQIGSIPRTRELIEANEAAASGEFSGTELARLRDEAVRETIARLEATGSPVVSDGEQAKSSFVTYPIEGLENLASGGVEIPFEDGHSRELPKLTGGPFRYAVNADRYLRKAQEYATVPVKQAVIAASALSLLYPQERLAEYPQDAFLTDLVNEAEIDVRRCLQAGAHCVQMDFTEGRLSIKLDPSKQLLGNFIALNNSVLDRFAPKERERIGVHTCPGGDQESTHSLDVDYLDLLPGLFDLHAGSFYIQMASESDKARVLGIIRDNRQDDHCVFVGVIDPLSSRVETPEEVRDLLLEAAEYIPPRQLGSCDDCGFSPFADDVTRSRETVFEKIAARVEGTRMASEKLGL